MKVRRIKVPRDLYLGSYRKMKSHWDWFWKHHNKDAPKRIIVDFSKNEG